MRKADFRRLFVIPSLLGMSGDGSGGPTHHFRPGSAESAEFRPKDDFRRLLVTFGQTWPKVTSGAA